MSKKTKEQRACRKLLNKVEIIDLPPLDSKTTYRIYSPRLKYPEHAKEFQMEVSVLPADEVSRTEAA